MPIPDRPWSHAKLTTRDQPWRPMRRRLKRRLGLELRDPGDHRGS